MGDLTIMGPFPYGNTILGAANVHALYLLNTHYYVTLEVLLEGHKCSSVQVLY